jgi:L-asparagine transporter-like permease
VTRPDAAGMTRIMGRRSADDLKALGWFWEAVIVLAILPVWILVSMLFDDDLVVPLVVAVVWGVLVGACVVAIAAVRRSRRS